MLSDHKKSRILVVEDDYCIGVLFEALLNPRFDVVLAATFDEALQSAALQHFDLFLLDIDLGEARTGIDLLAQLRQMPGGDAARAVACTSFSGENNRKYLLSCGFDAYVCKPFKRPELLAILEQALTDEPLEGRGLPVGTNKAIIPGINAT